MAIFFTSDFHLGDETLIHYGARHFKSGQRMSEVLIANANQRAKENDTIIHVGDFVAYGKDKGIESPKISGSQYLKMFKANIVLIEGNHDPNNHVPAICKSMTLDIGPFKNVTVSHHPSWFNQNFKIVPQTKGHIHICGHVHNKWKTMISPTGVLNINVGVDVWNNQIVSIQDLIKIIQKSIIF